QVLRKRPDIRREWGEEALRNPAHREVQGDGRVRYWIWVPELQKYLRVVTLEDGETVHNAFPDRGLKEVQPWSSITTPRPTRSTSIWPSGPAQRRARSRPAVGWPSTRRAGSMVGIPTRRACA